MCPYVNEEKNLRTIRTEDSDSKTKFEKKTFTKKCKDWFIRSILWSNRNNPFKTLPYKYAVSCHQSVSIRYNNAGQNLCPYMYHRTNQSVSTLSAIRQQTVGKLTIKLNAIKEPELINYSKKTRKSNDWNPRNSKLEEKWIRIRENEQPKNSPRACWWLKMTPPPLFLIHRPTSGQRPTKPWRNAVSRREEAVPVERMIKAPRPQRRSRASPNHQSVRMLPHMRLSSPWKDKSNQPAQTAYHSEKGQFLITQND